MTNKLKTACAAVAALFAAAAVAGKMPDAEEILLPGEYKGHLQDVWWDGAENIYWAHTWKIIKTDLAGNIVKSVDVKGHNAGCAIKDGVLYVAVCPTEKGRILPWGPDSRLQVNEYDIDTLALRAQHVMPAVDRAGSLAVLEDGSFAVGCLRPDDITASQVRFHHVSADFKILSTHLIDDMKIPMGIETIKRYGGNLYLSCYHGATVKVDAATFKEKDRSPSIGGECGLVYDGEHCWRAVTWRPEKNGKTWRSKLVRDDRGVAFIRK